MENLGGKIKIMSVNLSENKGFKKVAEGERFELSIPVKACRFSRPVHSTALPTLRSMFFNELAGI